MATATETVSYAVAPYCTDETFARIKARAEELEAEGLQTGCLSNSEVGDALRAEFGMEFYASDERMCNWYQLPDGTLIGEDRDVDYRRTSGALYNWIWDEEDVYDNHLCADALILARFEDAPEVIADYLTDRYDAETAAIALGITVKEPGTNGVWVPVVTESGHSTGVVKLCDPDTAERVGENRSKTPYSNDFDYSESILYLAPEGHYFEIGEGGARSRFASSNGKGWYGYGQGVLLCDKPESLLVY